MTALLSSSGCALPLGACRIVAGKKERRRRRSSAVTRGFPLVLIHAAVVGVNLSNDEDDHNNNHPRQEQGDDHVVDAPQEQWILCRTSASSLIDDEEPRQCEEEETCMLKLCFSSSITLKGFHKDGVGGGDGDDGDGGQPSSSLLERLWTATTTRSSDGVNPRHARTYRTRECPCNPCTKNSNPPSCHLYIMDDSDNTAAANVSASGPSTVTFFSPDNSHQIAPAVSVILTYTSASSCSNHEEDDEDESLSASEVILLETQPLLQSCIKRQLVGCPVVFYKSDDDGGGAGVTTEIRLPAAVTNRRMWTLTVQSMSVATSSASSIGGSCTTGAAVALILPSTRITLLPKQQPNQQQTGDKTKPLISNNQSNKPSGQSCMEQAVCRDDNDRLSISPAARILVDTINCMRRIHCCQSPPLSTSSDVPRTFLFTGPPGTGKSHAVRLAVQEAGGGARNRTRCHLVVLQGSEILAEAGHPAEAARSLERQFQKAAVQTNTAALTHRGQDDDDDDDDDERNNKYSTVPVAVIFLDECDALLSSSSPDSGTSVSVVEAVLGRLLDRLHADPAWRLVVVVAATNRIDSIPSSLRRPGRIDREIPLAPPNAATRHSILESLLQEQYGDHVFGNRARDQLGEIADACVGYVPADLAALVRRAELLRITQQPTVDSDDLACSQPTTITTTVDLLRRAMVDVGASALRDAALKAPPTTTFDDIAGDPGGAKTALRQAIEWPRTKSAAYRALGLTPPRGILLHGPPGCAKTTLARAAAGASAVAFVSLSPADVYSSSYVGDAEAVVRRAFALARSAAPCILFFDEIDAILGCSDGDGSGGSRSSHGMGRGSSNNAEARVLSTYLNEMEGVDGSREDGVLVLGATNRPWTLDAALLRPGRFDKVIYVPPPDYKGRRSILTMQCQHWNTVHGANIIAGAEIDRLASDAVTGNMTGAEIVGACREAAMLSFRDAAAESRSPVMNVDYLRTALDAVQPLLSNPTVMNEFQSFEDRRRRLSR